MRSKLLVLSAAVLVGISVQACSSSDPPKTGIRAQPGDYAHAPGGGGTAGAPPAGANPNKS